MHGEGTNLKLAAAYWKLNLLDSYDLVRIAIEALEADTDTPSLRILAGENPRYSALGELDPMFEKALKELDINLPSFEQAFHQIIKQHAEQIVAGTITPDEGVTLIWRATGLRGYYPEWLSDLMMKQSYYRYIAETVQNGNKQNEEARDQAAQDIIAEARKLIEMFDAD